MGNGNSVFGGWVGNGNEQPLSTSLISSLVPLAATTDCGGGIHPQVRCPPSCQTLEQEGSLLLDNGAVALRQISWPMTGRLVLAGGLALWPVCEFIPSSSLAILQARWPTNQAGRGLTAKPCF